MLKKIERLDWIDFAKGIGIILVLIGHSNFIPREMLCYIYSFHMPLFLFLSGFLFKYKSNLKDFLKKKISTTLIPYLSFFALLLISIGIKNFVIFNKIITIKTAINILVLKPGFVYSIWFLISLLFVEIIFNFILKVTNEKRIFVAIITVFCVFFSYVYFTYINNILFLQFQFIFSLLPFFSLGYLIKNSKYLKCFSNFYFILFNLISSMYLFLVKITYFIDYTSITSNVYGNILLFYLLAITSIFYIVGICQNVKYNKLINYIGKNSLVYFALQQTLITIPLSILFIKIGFNVNDLNMITRLFLLMVDLIFNVIVLSGANVIINNSKLKILIGKK